MSIAAPAGDVRGAILQFQFDGQAYAAVDNFVPPGTPISGRFSVNTVGTPGSVANADSMVYLVDAVLLQAGGLTMTSSASFASTLTISHGHVGFLDNVDLGMTFDIAVGPDSIYTGLPDPDVPGAGARLSDTSNPYPRGTLADLTNITNALAQLVGGRIIFSPGDYVFPGGSQHLPPVDIGSVQFMTLQAVPVPEPGSLVLALLGMAALVTVSARRRI